MLQNHCSVWQKKAINYNSGGGGGGGSSCCYCCRGGGVGSSGSIVNDDYDDIISHPWKNNRGGHKETLGCG